jgi:hypothetical protein
MTLEELENRADEEHLSWLRAIENRRHLLQDVERLKREIDDAEAIYRVSELRYVAARRAYLEMKLSRS